MHEYITCSLNQSTSIIQHQSIIIRCLNKIFVNPHGDKVSVKTIAGNRQYCCNIDSWE